MEMVIKNMKENGKMIKLLMDEIYENINKKIYKKI